MNRLLARRVQESEFTMVRWRRGYSAEEVDDFLDVLVARLLDGEPVAELLDGTRFRQVQGQASYTMSEVDDLLEEVRRAWQPSPDPGPGSDPVLVARLHDIRFRPVREPDAYVMTPVDQLLDDLESAATGGSSLQALLDSAVFTTVQKRQAGYPHDRVDGFLASLGRHTPSLVEHGAVIPEPHGLARLFGRRG